MIVFNSSFFSISAIDAFSVFKTLPRRGKMAWYFESRHFLALPPAELPSTKNNSNTNIQNDNQNSISDDTENEISNSDKSSNTIIEDEESENKDEIINNQEQTKEDTKQ